MSYRNPPKSEKEVNGTLPKISLKSIKANPKIAKVFLMIFALATEPVSPTKFLVCNYSN